MRGRRRALRANAGRGGCRARQPAIASRRASAHGLARHGAARCAVDAHAAHGLDAVVHGAGGPGARCARNAGQGGCAGARSVASARRRGSAVALPGGGGARHCRGEPLRGRLVWLQPHFDREHRLPPTPAEPDAALATNASQPAGRGGRCAHRGAPLHRSGRRNRTGQPRPVCTH